MRHPLSSGERDLVRGAIADIEIPSPGGRPNPSGHQAILSRLPGKVAGREATGRMGVESPHSQTTQQRMKFTS